MTKLVLGVIDQPYANPPRSKRAKAKSGTQTTADVAQWLEDEYHIMEIFFEVHKADIAKELEASVAGSLTAVLNGAPASLDVFGEGTADIEKRMKAFISNREIESLGYPGVPTQAALDGVDHRLKHPYAKGNPRRASFSDTGLYESSMKAWIEK